jgi:GAF domain-containing protein
MVTTPDRFRLLYDLSRRLATFDDLDDLVRYATRRTRELFSADGCSILLLDRARKEFTFPVASQKEATLAAQARLDEIRFPADAGIAGWVLAHDEAALVRDAQKDSRFYAGVDKSTGLVTRAVICAPLRTRSGNIGVIEVINPAGAAPGQDDLELLETVASDVAVAHEKAALYDAVRGEAVGLRRLCGTLGGGLLAVGALLGAGAVYGQLVRVLPLGDLVRHPGLWVGGLAIALGALLIAVWRGWIMGAHAGMERT